VGRFAALRPTIRRLARRPEGVVLSLLTLGLGIGVSAALYTVVHDVLLQPLPYPEADRLVGVSHTATGMFVDEFELSEGSYRTFAEDARTLEALALVEEGRASLTGEGSPERIEITRVTPSLLSVLRVEPQVGRGFTAEEGRPRGEPVVLLGARLWARRFGSDPGVVGRRIELDGVARTVVGVLPPSLDFPAREVEAWLPMVIDPAAPDTGNFSHQAVGRLRAGVGADEAERELTALVPRIVELYPGGGLSPEELERVDLKARVRPLREVVVGEVGDVLWPLFGGCGILLLISCGNVANLMLVRAEGRSREIAVRSALGAGRWRLAGDLAAEAFLLAAGGGLLGLAFGATGVELLEAVGPERIPRLHEVAFGVPAFGFTAAVALLSGILFAVLPLLRQGGPALAGSLAESLSEGSRGSSSGRRRLRASDLLVAGQIALALVLLVGSGLMVRSYWALSRVDPGFEADGALTFRLALPASRYGGAQQRARQVEEIIDRLRALPGVEEVAATNYLPLGGQLSAFAHRPEGWSAGSDELPPMLAAFDVTPGFFSALGIELEAGDGFEQSDVDGSRRVVVVNRMAAEELWPGERAVGKRLALGTGEDAPWFTVVGVVENVRNRTLDWGAEMAAYYPFVVHGSEELLAPENVSVVVRSSVPPAGLFESVRKAVWDVAPDMPVAELRTMDALVARATARTRFVTLLLLAGAAVGLVLGTVGLYGVVSYAVARRTRELAVRLAVGAQRLQVRTLVLRRAGWLAVFGVAVGAAGAMLAGRGLEALLFGVAPTDPVTLVLAALLLTVVVLLAADAPARRAAAVDPVVSLRSE